MQLLLNIAVIIGSIGLFGLMIFQLMLAVGLPYGKMAWGGKYEVLPAKLRIGSLSSSLVIIYAVIVILEKGGYLFLINNHSVLTLSSWVFVILFGLSTLGNITSKSEKEKYFMTPLAVILTLSFLIVSLCP